MKFAKVLEQTLIEEEIPNAWVGAAIQYKLLKKCINKVVDELKFLGLEQNTLKVLLEDTTSRSIIEVDESAAVATNPVIAEYSLTRSKGSSSIKPMLKITIDYSQEDYTDDHIVELGVELKEKIEKLLNSEEDEEEGGVYLLKRNIVELKENNVLILSPQTSQKDDQHSDIQSNNLNNKREKKNEIIIVLNSDSKFFQMLDSELEALDKLQKDEEGKLMQEVENILGVVKTLAGPSTVKALKRSDLYKWREIFRIYLDLEVFFRYNETSIANLERNSGQIKQKFGQFMDRVTKLDILSQFHNKKSLIAFNNFVAMNEHLLKVLQFQAINTTAMRKILKKFDKQTSLGVSHVFPKLVLADHIFITGASLAQSICFVMQNLLLQLIPQLDDYTCPICCLVAFKPIKLLCGHLFCVRCLVKLKGQDKTNCPICRHEGAILQADSLNLDLVKLELMQKYFPLEVKEKLRERDKERYDEMVGNGNRHNKCAVQ